MIIEGCHPQALPVQQPCLTVLLQLRRALLLPVTREKQNACKKPAKSCPHRWMSASALRWTSCAMPVVPCLLRCLLHCRRLTLPSSRASLNSMARNWLIKGEANTLLGYLVPLA